MMWPDHASLRLLTMARLLFACSGVYLLCCALYSLILIVMPIFLLLQTALKQHKIWLQDKSVQ